MQLLSVHKHHQTQGGFSLIEVLLYVAIFSVMSVISMNTLFQAIKSFDSLRISRDINDSSVGIMERLTRDIKGSTGVDLANSTFTTSPGRLTLSTVSASGTPMTVEYYVASSMLRYKEDGVDKGSLMSAKTTIDALVFRYINSGSTIGIKIELHLASSRGGVTKVDHFYDTVLMRGTY
jgi:prepilin-type N-terminal cleavage/methylation domain-containing protein